MATQALRADATLDVSPPPIRLVAGARVGLFYNLGHAVGPAAFIEALRPLPLRRLAAFVGATVGYLNAEISGAGPDANGSAHLEIDQVPFLALARARLPLLLRFELSGELAAGMSVAHSKLSTAAGGEGFEASGTSYAPAFGGGADVGLTLKPGRLVIGLRYLWSRLGRTSQGDEITGNSAGLIGDIGYRMTF
jgi:hypothetical protein